MLRGLVLCSPPADPCAAKTEMVTRESCPSGATSMLPRWVQHSPTYVGSVQSRVAEAIGNGGDVSRQQRVKPSAVATGKGSHDRHALTERPGCGQYIIFSATSMP